MKIITDRAITIEMNAMDLDRFAEEVYRLQRQSRHEYFPCNSVEYADRYPTIYRILLEAS